jgi:hypothetical protein
MLMGQEQQDHHEALTIVLPAKPYAASDQPAAPAILHQSCPTP